MAAGGSVLVLTGSVSGVAAGIGAVELLEEGLMSSIKLAGTGRIGPSVAGWVDRSEADRRDSTFPLTSGRVLRTCFSGLSERGQVLFQVRLNTRQAQAGNVHSSTYSQLVEKWFRLRLQGRQWPHSAGQAELELKQAAE